MADYANLSADELKALLVQRDAAEQQRIQQEQQRNQQEQQRQQVQQIIRIQPSIPLPESWNTKASDLSTSFETFIMHWENYVIASSLDEIPDNQKVGIFWSALGPHGMQKCIKDWNFSAQDRATVQAVIAKIREKLQGQRIPMIDRVKFLECVRDEDNNETISEYVERAEKLVNFCNYGNAKDEMLLQQIVRGMKDKELQKELLCTQNLTWQIAKQKIQARKICDSQMELFYKEVKQEPGTVKKIDHKLAKTKCSRCNFMHKKGLEFCSAQGKVCNYCKGKNHYETVCFKKAKDEKSSDKQSKKKKDSEWKYKSRKSHQKSKQCKMVEHSDSESSSDPESDNDSMIISMVSANNRNGAYANLELKTDEGWKKVQCQLDTGSACNLIGISNLKSLRENPKLSPSSCRLQDVQKNAIKSLGKVKILFERKSQKYSLTFQVVDFDQMPLLSEETCRTLQLIKYCKSVDTEDWITKGRHEAQQILNEFSDVFEGHGELPGIVSLELHDNVKPVIAKPRKVPHAYRDKLKQELEELERNGIIVKETEPTDWVSNILIVNRNGKMRLCLDPTYLNRALKRPHYQYNTFEEATIDLENVGILTSLDTKRGFLQKKLDEKSSKMTTFYTPFGKFRFTRLCFGLICSSDYFQETIDSECHDLTGVIKIRDDFAVYGTGNSPEQIIKSHNVNLRSLLSRLRKINCKLNRDKIKLFQTEIKFFGNLLTTKGIKPDSEKIKAIKNMPAPENKKDLERFLGMVNFLAKFIQNASAECHHLRALATSIDDWKWTNEDQNEYERVKNLLSDEKMLKYFEKHKPVVIECDASSKGLGAYIQQEDKIVAYASRTLSPAEKNYSQIEKEMLAIVFACHRFKQFIEGNKSTIHTDHKSLINIFNKPILDVPKRLQMMMLHIHRYNLELVYVPGTKLIIADTLSRQPCNAYDSDSESDQVTNTNIFNNIAVISLRDQVKVSDKRLEDIKTATDEDQGLQQIIQYINSEWPNNIHKVSDAAKPYYKFKEELAVENGIVYREGKIVIPLKLRKFMTDRVHQHHLGIENTINLAKDNLFWPGMRAQITEKVQSCDTCLKYSDNNPKLPMQSVEIPEHPFQIVSMDVFEITTKKGKKKKFLVTIDHYSDYFEVDQLPDLTPQSTIKICKKNFRTHGIPETVISDNATNFQCTEFSKFARDWEFNHSTSSPHHPRGNGKAEAAVKVAKKLLKKCEENDEDFDFLILQHRNTPNKIKSSPVQRLFSRRTRCGIPTSQSNLKPKVIESVPETIESNKQKSKQNYDKSTKKLPQLETGEKIAFKLRPENEKTWTYGTVVDCAKDRSYIIEHDGKQLRRNREHIKPKKEVSNEKESSSTNERNSEQQRETSPSKSNNEESSNNEYSLRQPPQPSTSSSPIYNTPKNRPPQAEITNAPLRPTRNRRPPDRLKF